MLCFCIRVAWACLVCLLLCKEEGFLWCLSNYWEEGYADGPVWGALVYVFIGFWDGDYVSQLPYVCYYDVVKSRFQHASEDASPKGLMCFRCLMCSLLRPCELLFLLCFIASWTWVVVSVIIYPCIFCVSLLMDQFVLCIAGLTVFVNCLVKQFAICLGVVITLLCHCHLLPEVLTQKKIIRLPTFSKYLAYTETISKYLNIIIFNSLYYYIIWLLNTLCEVNAKNRDSSWVKLRDNILL